MNQQMQNQDIPPSDALLEEDAHLVVTFKEMEKQQFAFLDESGKSLIERTSAFLAIIFALTAFGNQFPPAYLHDNTLLKWLTIVTVVFALVSIILAGVAIQPRKYRFYRHNMTALDGEL